MRNYFFVQKCDYFPIHQIIDMFWLVLVRNYFFVQKCDYFLIHQIIDMFWLVLVRNYFFVQKCDYFLIHQIIDMFRCSKELSSQVGSFEYPQQVSVYY